MSNLWNWFKGTEEVEEDGLKAAVEQNKLVAKIATQTAKVSKSKASKLIGLAQNGLDILSRIEEKQK